MVNKIISYMNYCRIKDELQYKLDKDLKFYGLDNKAGGGLRTVYVTDMNKPHEMLVEFGIGINGMDRLTPYDVARLNIVLYNIRIEVEKVNESYKGYKYEF